MKVLIVGLGSIAKKHITALQQIGQFDIYSLRSSKSNDNIDYVTNIYSWGEAKSVNPDFIIISNPTSHHADAIKNSMSLNKPLFIEKPILGTIDEDTNNLIKKLTDSNTLTYVACNLRFLDSLKFLSETLGDKDFKHQINEVNIYCGSYLPNWRPNVDYKQCYSSDPNKGGGVHLDLIHELDYTFWLFGMPEEIKSTFRNCSSIGIKAFDYANYLLIYPNFCTNIILNYYRRDYKRTMEIVFDDFTWNLDLSSNTIMDNNGKTIFNSSQTIIDTYKPQLQYFIDNVVKRQKPSFNDARIAYNVLKKAVNHV